MKAERLEMEGQSDRLESLDVLRGFDMFFITGGSLLLAAIGTLVAGNDHCWLATQMQHVQWEGLHLFDLIFPLFLFITGVTFPFSTAKRLARGEGKADIARNILRRALTLVVLGVLYENVQAMDWPNFRVWSVIGRIGVVWAAAALVTLYCRPRTGVVVVLTILVGWWLLLRMVPAPGSEPGLDPIGVQDACLSAWVDVHWLTTAHRHEGGLATLAMLPTAFFGIWAGEYLRRTEEGLTPAGKVLRMLAVSVAMVVLGAVWAIPSWGMPIVKIIWTGSYALVSGGISLALLAVFHWLVDIRGWKTWCFFFKVIGVNAIAIYFVSRFVPFRSVGLFFLGGLATASAMPGWEAFVGALGRCASGWLFLLFLYRHRIFFKV